MTRNKAAEYPCSRETSPWIDFWPFLFIVREEKGERKAFSSFRRPQLIDGPREEQEGGAPDRLSENGAGAIHI